MIWLCYLLWPKAIYMYFHFAKGFLRWPDRFDCGLVNWRHNLTLIAFSVSHDSRDGVGVQCFFMIVYAMENHYALLCLTRRIRLVSADFSRFFPILKQSTINYIKPYFSIQYTIIHGHLICSLMYSVTSHQTMYYSNWESIHIILSAADP